LQNRFMPKCDELLTKDKRSSSGRDMQQEYPEHSHRTGKVDPVHRHNRRSRGQFTSEKYEDPQDQAHRPKSARGLADGHVGIPR